MLMELATWNIIEDGTSILVKGFRWIISIKSTIKNELGGIDKEARAKVVGIRTKAKSLPIKLDNVQENH